MSAIIFYKSLEKIYLFIDERIRINFTILICVSEYVCTRSIYVHFDNEEGAADQFHRFNRCVTANTWGIPVQYHSKPRDTGVLASFRVVELATAIARLFARCRAICTHIS